MRSLLKNTLAYLSRFAQAAWLPALIISIAALSVSTCSLLYTKANFQMQINSQRPNFSIDLKIKGSKIVFSERNFSNYAAKDVLLNVFFAGYDEKVVNLKTFSIIENVDPSDTLGPTIIPVSPLQITSGIFAVCLSYEAGDNRYSQKSIWVPISPDKEALAKSPLSDTYVTEVSHPSPEMSNALAKFFKC